MQPSIHFAVVRKSLFRASMSFFHIIAIWTDGGFFTLIQSKTRLRLAPREPHEDKLRMIGLLHEEIQPPLFLRTGATAKFRRAIFAASLTPKENICRRRFGISISQTAHGQSGVRAKLGIVPDSMTTRYPNWECKRQIRPSHSSKTGRFVAC
jgi:hypothetical protein